MSRFSRVLTRKTHFSAAGCHWLRQCLRPSDQVSGRRLRLETLEHRSLLTVLPVTTPLDVVDANDGVVSFREAIIQANVTNGADTITLPAGTYTLSIAGANEDAALTSDLDLSGRLTIQGSGSGSTIIDGAGLDRVFHVLADSTVTLASVAVRGGTARQTADGFTGVGGGVYTSGTLTILNSALEGNAADYGGGILSGSGLLTLSNTTLSGNSAVLGSAIYSVYHSVVVNDSMVSDNLGDSAIFATVGGAVIVRSTSFVGNSGAAISAQRTDVTVDSSTFANNLGGGIVNGYSNLTAHDTTFRGNSATGFVGLGDGGAIFSLLDYGQKTTVIHCSFSNNTAWYAGGAIAVGGQSGSFTLRDSSFTGNWAGADGVGSGVGGAITIGKVDATISNSTFSGNVADYGGAIISSAPATISNSTFTANSAGFDGGAIYNGGIMNISNSIFTGNSAGNNGGAIYNFGFGTLVVSGSTLSGNSAGNNGGAIFNDVSATLTVRDSIRSDNTAGNFGGAVYNEGTLTVRNSKVRNNSALLGRDVYNLGLASLIDSVIGDIFP